MENCRRVVCVCPFFPYSRNLEPEDLSFDEPKSIYNNIKFT